MIGFKASAHRRALGVCALLALAGLTGCVAPPSYRNRPVAADAPSTFVLAHAAIVEEPRHATRHLNEAKTIVYTQAQGGSLTAGLVFGALGALANMGMIDSQTGLDAARMQGKLGLEPRQLFLDAAIRQGLEFTDAGGATRTGATPYLAISKSPSGRLLAAAAVRLEQGSGADRWSGLYMYQLPSTYGLDELARPSEDLQRKLAAEAAQGFGELAGFIAREEAGRKDASAKAPEREFAFSTELLTPGAGHPTPARLIASSQELVWFRTFDGVFALRRSSMKIRTRGI
ncbi:hypothetical protein QFZ42_001753 [Variovorax paradoxus]|uniref:hypothetical protein n=1 Tax=Variovorax paradoxus TaxID=34073 RepID=UPI00278CA340|nr:hypothetical protein [Variovorax paradoxus]MDQ0569919.1 hypothetical protein [Variovorax paradoxus]